MDVPLKQTMADGINVLETVSILVLVDVPLKLKKSKLVAVPNGGFNPCFGGCSIKTHNPDLVVVCDTVVSILVLVDVPLKQKQFRAKRGNSGSFNPCFGGCSIKTAVLSMATIGSPSSFNPCFGGCSIKTIEEGEDGNRCL